MKRHIGLYLLTFSLCCMNGVFAQFNGVLSIGSNGDHSTLQSAVNYLNIVAVDGPVVLELKADYNPDGEIYPIVLPGIAGASSSNTITIRPTAGSPGITITSSEVATLDIDGGDHYIIDGRPGGAGQNSGLKIRNTHTAGCAVWFRNDARWNKITYCTLSSSGVTETTGTVLLGNSNGTQGNTGNIIEFSKIHEAVAYPYHAIYSLGTSGLLNDNTVISDNEISNFQKAGVMLAYGSGENWVINNNHFFMTGISNLDQRAVRVEDITCINVLVKDNWIGGSEKYALGNPWSTQGTSFTGIEISNDNLNPSTVFGNTIRNIVQLSTGSFTGITTYSNLCQIQQNTIGYSDTSGIVSPGIFMTGILSTEGMVLNNTIAGLSQTNTSADAVLYGIRANGGTIAGNIIKNCHTASSKTNPESALDGIHVETPQDGLATIKGNLIYNLHCSQLATTTLNGIWLDASTTGNFTISKNQVFSLKTGNTGAYVSGVNVKAGTGRVDGNIIRLGKDSAAVNVMGFDAYLQGVVCAGNEKVDLFYNTIVIEGLLDLASSSTFALMLLSNQNDIIQNNVLVNYRNQSFGAVNHYNLYLSTGVGKSVDHNCYHNSISNAILIDVAGTKYVDLSTWRAASSQDANSLFTDPLFKSGADLHVAPGSPLIGAGVWVVSLDQDIDGEPRNNPPTIGADEHVVDIPELPHVTFGKDILYVHPHDNSDGSQWYNGVYLVTGASSLTDGRANSSAIVAAQGAGDYAAHLCDTLFSHGFDDWYLPAKNELDTLYASKGSFGGIKAAKYWSSTEVSNQLAYNVNLGSGASTVDNKLVYGLSVRCVRRVSAPVQETLTDIDNNIYETVQIGSQTWMKENLRVTKYNNGAPINYISSDSEWKTAVTGAHAAYQNATDPDSIHALGLLYNLPAVKTGKLCPVGWHVPSNAEWNVLVNQFGGENEAGGPLKDTTHYWLSPNAGATDGAGFSARPGGMRSSITGEFTGIGTSGYWWTTTQFSTSAYGRTADFQDTYFDYNSYEGVSGLSIRCIKNQDIISGFNYGIDPELKTLTITDTSSSNTTNYYWQFGNGAVSTDKNPVVSFGKGGYYRITQSILDTLSGTIAQTEKIVYINDGTVDCEADFDYATDTTTHTVLFTNTSPNYASSTCLWNFGDGGSSVEENPAYQFTGDGSFNVCLTVKSSGCRNISCQRVQSGSGANTLQAAFIYVADNATRKVVFNDQSSNALKWEWHFGNGATSKERHPQYTYPSAGMYHVVLKATGQGGTILYYSKLLNVGTGIDSLRCSFGYRKDTTYLNKGVLPIEFDGAAYGDPAQVEWDFGDGTTNTSSTTPSHEYADTGTYTVCYTVADSLLEQSHTACQEVVIGTGDTVVGILVREHPMMQVEVYPNPTEQYVICRWESDDTDPADVRLYDITGREVLVTKSHHQPQVTIDLLGLQNGIYYLKVEIKEYQSMKMIIKQ